MPAGADRSGADACPDLGAGLHRLADRADPGGVLRLIHERLAELARSGYRHQPATGAVRHDQRAAREMSCPECLHRGLHFMAFAHPRRPGHVALAWCDLCRVAIDVPPAPPPRGAALAGVAEDRLERR
jgi:hypothetical protein